MTEETPFWVSIRPPNRSERPESTGFRSYADSYMEAFSRERFVSGELPFMKEEGFDNVLLPPDTLPGGKLCREVHLTEDGKRCIRVFEGDDWVIHFSFGIENHGILVSAYAKTREKTESLLKLVKARAGIYQEPSDKTEPLSFWCATSNGPSQKTRRLDVPVWEDVEQNYSVSASSALGKLVGIRPNDDATGGRLILFHGPPGTGKTTMLRTLAKEWASWCSVEAILDPEKLFGDASYLSSVMLSNSSQKPWRMLVLEDCDELIRGDAKTHTGQAMARLLNLSDGLLGQGQKLLIVLTTNEPLGALHPAVIRPGRCLAEVEVGPLSADEASAWLGETVSQPMTLAELYAKKNSSDPTRARTEQTHVPTGQYL